MQGHPSGTPLVYDSYRARRYGLGNRENLTPSPDLPNRVKIDSPTPNESGSGSLPRPILHSDDWTRPGRKLDDRPSDYEKFKRAYEIKVEALEIHRAEIDGWEKKLIEWRKQVTAKQQARERLLQEKLKTHNECAMQFEEQMCSEREALKAEKDALRKSRLESAGEFDDKGRFLRFRMKEFKELERSLLPRIETCDLREATLDKRESKLQNLEADLGKRESDLHAREMKAEELSEKSEAKEEALSRKQDEIEELQKDLRTKLRESEACLEDLQQREIALLAQKEDFDNRNQMLQELVSQLKERENIMIKRERDIEKRDEDFSKSLEEASQELAESERENEQKSREIELEVAKQAELSKRLSKWSDELRRVNDKVTERERDLEAREGHLSKYLSSFEPV